MKLTLIFPGWCFVFGRFKKAAKGVSSVPPLNLCYVAALAEKAGWEVQLIDAELEDLENADIIKRIADFKPDLIGLTATSPFFRSVSETARAIKEHFTTPIIMGGAHVSIVREKDFLDIFDYLFIGECEETLPDFLESFSSGKRGYGVPGIMTRQNGKVVFYGETRKVQNLDDIPWPARHLIPYKKYFVGTLKGRLNHTSLLMTRGCPFKCVFCAKGIYGNVVRSRSAEGVIEEIEYIVNEMGIKHISFVDDVLTLNRKFILALCDEIEKRNLKFTFEGSTRSNLWDEEMVRRMKECGLIRISFGLESADPEVRKIIKKEVPLESHAKANRLSARYGIETINSVMFGLPGEDREKIERTIQYLRKARYIQHATYSIASPYPGTEMLEMAKKGLHGLKLVDEDPSHCQRYSSAVMEVNGIKPEELLELQKEGLRRIYSCWWRVLPMLRRHGLRVLVPHAVDFINNIFSPKRSLGGKEKT